MAGTGDASMDLGGSTQAMTGMGPNTWGAQRLNARLGARMADSRVDPSSPLVMDQQFRTTCPKGDEDNTDEKWAMHYDSNQCTLSTMPAGQSLRKKARTSSCGLSPESKSLHSI